MNDLLIKYTFKTSFSAYSKQKFKAGVRCAFFPVCIHIYDDIKKTAFIYIYICIYKRDIKKPFSTILPCP